MKAVAAQIAKVVIVAFQRLVAMDIVCLAALSRDDSDPIPPLPLEFLQLLHTPRPHLNLVLPRHFPILQKFLLPLLPGHTAI